MTKAKQTGYTLTELLFVIGFFSFWGVVGWVIRHFVVKFW